MAASNDDTADLFGSLLQETSGSLQVSPANSSDSESSREDMDASDLGNETQELGGSGTAEDGTERAATHIETIDDSTPTISAA
eukprot:SAG11_NODE_357_length_10240_cov_4.621142_3_plen_83_part_00